MGRAWAMARFAAHTQLGGLDFECRGQIHGACRMAAETSQRGAHGIEHPIDNVGWGLMAGREAHRFRCAVVRQTVFDEGFVTCLTDPRGCFLACAESPLPLTSWC